jgi:serine phosphatase RsbU (regulator of sigma subunit)
MKLRAFYLLFFIGISLLPVTVMAQNRALDSLFRVLKTEKEDTNKVNTLYDLSTAYYSLGNYKGTDSEANKQLALALALNFKIGAARAYDMIGKAFTGNDKYNEALKNYTEALKIATELDDKKLLATVYGDIGIIYKNEGNNAEALKNQLKALQIREQMADSLHIDIVCGNIGNIYNELGDYTNSLKYKQRSLEIAEKIKDTLGMAYAYGDMGTIYVSQKNYPKALAALQKALTISNQLNDKQGAGNAYVNIGLIYYYRNSFDTSLIYYKLGLDLYRAMGSQYLMCYGYLNIASSYTKLKKYAEAQVYIDSTLSTCKKIGDKEMLKETYQALAVLDSSTGKNMNAFADYKLYTQYGDSLKNEESTKKIVSEEMNYEFDKKQAIEKAEQDKKDLITEDKSKRQKLTILFMALIALAVGVIAVVILRSLRITRKQKTLIEQQKLVVEEQKLLVEQQKAIVDEKNKDITDSIHYASRIQRALLTSNDFISKRLKEYFILFKPRDIVSGDFYWANEVETNAGKRFLICAGDCTGHGVPGAFMSLLNISLLNEVNIEKSIHEPHAILDDVREHIIKALNPEGLSTGSQDGMDCVLCSFDLTSYMLSFACANNPLWIVRGTELIESKADKMPVGIQEGYKPFSSQSLQLQKGDVVYIFTDGYADQFGGPKGKKFKYKQLQEVLLANAHRPMAEQKELLALTIENWKGELEQVDDILIIGIRV